MALAALNDLRDEDVAHAHFAPRVLRRLLQKRRLN
jgi:hypothetical protein